MILKYFAQFFSLVDTMLHPIFTYFLLCYYFLIQPHKLSDNHVDSKILNGLDTGFELNIGGSYIVKSSVPFGCVHNHSSKQKRKAFLLSLPTRTLKIFNLTIRFIYYQYTYARKSWYLKLGFHCRPDREVTADPWYTGGAFISADSLDQFLDKDSYLQSLLQNRLLIIEVSKM